MTFTLRTHQVECLEHAKQKNSIACLPTGYGKTLIAAKLIEHYLTLFPHKKVAFLVPTRPLVEQQAKYCETHCKVPIVVERVFGEEQANWTRHDWDDSCQRSHVFLGTAALFQQAFVTDKYLSLDKFSLLIFDECHNCVGNAPMAAVMRDAVAPYYDHLQTTLNNNNNNSGNRMVASQRLRILGLTASFVNGSLKNIAKKRQKLEALMLSTIICPNVESRLEAKDFTLISWQGKNKSQDAERQQGEAIDRHARQAITTVANVKEMTKVVSRCSHVFKELGGEALKHYIQHVIVSQILAKINVMERLGEEHSTRAAAKMRSSLPLLQQSLNRLWLGLSTDSSAAVGCLQKGAAGINNGHSKKLERLLELLDEIFTTANHQYDGYRGIVFVEQVALVSPLADQIDKFFLSTSSRQNNISCAAIAGTGAQTDSDRHRRLESFRLGHTQILVTTATLEEGVDVSECAFVIRFNALATTKAHIQGSGRARHSNARIYYFQNDPDQECRKEGVMTSVARDASLRLSEAALTKSSTTMNVALHDRHPYPFGSRRRRGEDGTTTTTAFVPSGEVNVYNAK